MLWNSLFVNFEPIFKSKSTSSCTPQILFFLFKSNYNCLFSHVNDVALAVTKLQKHRGMFGIALGTARVKLVRPQCFNIEKSSSGDNFEQGGSVQCIVFFNLVKLNMHLKKITHLKKFSSNRNWDQMKKLDSFCEKLSVNQVNFSS